MIRAITTVLSSRRHLVYFIVIADLILFALFQFQVEAIPGNDLAFQAKIFGFKDWLLLSSISVLNSLFITTEVYIFGLKREHRQAMGLAKSATISGAGSASGVLASVFGTATCSLCVSALFGFLGANSVLFLVDHKDLIASLAVVLLLVSLFISSRRFSAACKACKV